MHSSTQDLPLVWNEGAVEIRQLEAGSMMLSHERAPAGMDNAALFKGLPGDRCPCEHWGYVLKGSLRVSYAEHEEIIRAGEVYYLAPGHTVRVEEDGELVEFTPKDMFARTMEVAARNFAAMQQQV